MYVGISISEDIRAASHHQPSIHNAAVYHFYDSLFLRAPVTLVRGVETLGCDARWLVSLGKISHARIGSRILTPHVGERVLRNNSSRCHVSLHLGTEEGRMQVVSSVHEAFWF